jgi:hypothetical protein
VMAHVQKTDGKLPDTIASGQSISAHRYKLYSELYAELGQTKY